ncbi:MAG: DNA mismatch repair endonuclease MutL [Clostridiaceae bacterium]|nr:DNA mismatch repair endonuclease MutL [Clostridiaceae bacterium]
MNIVKKLSPHVADLIAAGEVVERPASVVKELMENAVDAGATQVTVEIRNGGIDLIRVTDNGCGMSREDAQTCFIRHATSKISEEEDLHAILTLGFRGEALAAISAVARVELVTRMAEDTAGTRVTLAGGEIQSVDDAGCPVGTTITVEKLFYNTPARMKFLKKNATEAGYCAAAADKLALAHPEVAVRFIKDGRDAMRTPGDGKLRSAVYGVCGREFAASLTPVEQEETLSLSGPRMTVWGFVTKPELSLSTRNSQYFILNGRFIRSRTMGAALEEAYRGSIMTGKYPGCVLQAAIDPAYVDVNVHPAKTEVKFADERAVFEAVYVAVKRALEGAARPSFAAPRAPAAPEAPTEEAHTVHLPEKTAEPVKTPAGVPHFSVPETPEQSRFAPQVLRAPAPVYQLQPAHGVIPHRFVPDVNAEDFENAIQPEPEKMPENPLQPLPDPVPAEPETQAPAEEATENYRIVGELFHSYIVVELDDEIMYIDKHAAHERILYNALKTQETAVASQILLEPLLLPLSPEDMELIDTHRELLAEAGIVADDFGGGTLIVREIPQHIDAAQAGELIADICGRMRAGEPDGIRNDILHSIACKAAIKAGWHTAPDEQEALVQKVLRLPDVRYCPHGRPVALVTSRREFEKGFRRVL